MDNIFAERIESLRSMMRSRGWDAVLLTGSDPHGSEYPAERWKQVEWLTGFTGEAGDVVVTLDHAGIWTDSRYFIQAGIQLKGTGVELHKTRVPGEVGIPQWLAERFSAESEVYFALDGLCAGNDFAKEIKSALNAGGAACHLVSIPNMMDAVWKDRPGIPQTPVFSVDPGESRIERLGRIRDWAAGRGVDYVLLSALDEIAWALNVRGSDIEYNPLVISYLLIRQDSADWFVLKEAVEDPLTQHTLEELREDGVFVRYYEEAEIALSELDGTVAAGGLNFHLSSLLGPARLVNLPSPVQEWKAVKTSVEIEGMRRSHLRDGIAMENFLWWLDRCMQNDRRITERDAALKLAQLRAAADEYTGDSFATISAYGPGAALPHYITPDTDAPALEPHGLYLCDSGAQYTDGTTDITRTVPLGPCTELEAEDYTLTLRGHIALARAVFPALTPGCRLDALARFPLWEKLRNFGHGTGHGVGWFLGVHEGPQDIRQNLNPTGFKAGMIVSDEPGIYREGMHGVRHENLLLCVPAGSNGFGEWLRFEPLTLCHFDTSIIVKELLGREESEWLNEYNAIVYTTLSPHLGEEAAAWLRKKTLPI
ncbi:MAG: aminopeptidase P family protein [Bacteroidales bacterium]|nr:aminopeptidase P family protein [Bacteroidales bacterium]